MSSGLAVESDLQIDAFVQWNSQAGGHTKTKIGRISQIVLPGDVPDRERFLSLFKHSGCGSGRTHVSYVVTVSKSGCQDKYYWPIASKLAVIVVQDIVKKFYRHASASYFSGSCDWEIYETEGTDGVVLGSGVSEESAWTNAASNLFHPKRQHKSVHR